MVRRFVGLPILLVCVCALVQAANAAPAADAVAAAMVPGNTSLTAWLAVLPILLPMLGSALTLTLRHRREWQAPISLVALGLATLAAAGLNALVAEEGTVVMAAGNWKPPFGIVIAVDALGALLVLVTCLVGLIGVSYARGDVDGEGVRYGFYSFYCLLVAGVCGAFSTGDIFNLYVWFEVFLVSSFGLMVLGQERMQLDGAVKYGILNLIATTIFLIAVGALYGFTGTLNMADIRRVLAASEGAPVATVGALFVLAFVMKAAAFPLHYWLPASYHTPKTIVMALFAGLLTKVGVYSLLRVMVMLFGADGAPFLSLVGWVGGLTAVLGALGAVAQSDLRRMAAFLVISGVGVMLVGLGLDSQAGLSGAIVYAVHSILVMTALFLAIGYTERVGGRPRALAGADLYSGHALAAAMFLVFGFSAAGLPPFSGFWPKMMLVEAALAAGGAAAVGGVVAVIGSGFLTTVAVARAWALVFLRPAAEPEGAAAGAAAAAADGRMAVAAPGGRLALAAPLVIFALLVVGLGLFPNWVIAPARVGAAGLLDPAVYIQRVLGAQ